MQSKKQIMISPMLLCVCFLVAACKKESNNTPLGDAGDVGDANFFDASSDATPVEALMADFALPVDHNLLANAACTQGGIFSCKTCAISGSYKFVRQVADGENCEKIIPDGTKCTFAMAARNLRIECPGLLGTLFNASIDHGFNSSTMGDFESWKLCGPRGFATFPGSGFAGQGMLSISMPMPDAATFSDHDAQSAIAVDLTHVTVRAGYADLTARGCQYLLEAM